MYNYITFGITVLILIISAITDIKTKKILNIITFPSMLLGILLMVIFKQYSFIGIRLIWMSVFFLLGTTGMVGLGDIKLLMAMTSLRGIEETSMALLLGAVFLAIYCFITETSMMKQIIRETFHYFTLKTEIVRISEKKYPFAVFVFAGYLTYIGLILLITNFCK